MAPDTVVTPSAEKDPSFKPVVIDLGKYSRKNVKKLRTGRPGKLMDKVHDALVVLREEGVIPSSGSAQPVVIVVRERPRTRGGICDLLR
jgi:Family of unknown function (DUF6200)